MGSLAKFSRLPMQFASEAKTGSVQNASESLKLSGLFNVKIEWTNRDSSMACSITSKRGCRNRVSVETPFWEKTGMKTNHFRLLTLIVLMNSSLSSFDHLSMSRRSNNHTATGWETYYKMWSNWMFPLSVNTTRPLELPTCCVDFFLPE